MVGNALTKTEKMNVMVGNGEPSDVKGMQIFSALQKWEFGNEI